MKSNVSKWEIHLSNANWFRTKNVSVCGYIFTQENELLTGIDMCRYFDVSVPQQFIDRLKSANGLYSVVCHSERLQMAAVDPSRIYPLYYRKGENGVSIADNPYLLLQKGDNLDVNSLAEYHVAGYPLGDKTLVRDIYHVPPGGVLYGDGNTKKYYSYLAFSSELQSPNYDRTERMLYHVFSRMLQSLEGQQVVVPLSGGNDSRLILCMLRRLHYENVVCYTVGRPENVEELIATKVARELGYPLYIIDTTNEELTEYVCLDDKEFQRYYHFIGGLSNFMWLFEYVAIKWLKSQGILSRGAVFIPGHSADFNAGSHLVKACVGSNNRANYIANAIMIDNFEYGVDRQVWKKLYQYSAESKINKEIVSWSVYQSFVFQNRLPYNINNSARVYQFFGYDVRLPYWDKEFLELFRVMPYECLNGCSFYENFVRERIFKPMNVDYSRKHPSFYYFIRMKLLKRLKWLMPIFIRNRINKIDLLGELLLSKHMQQELILHKQYSERDKCSANQFMKDWYLLKVEEKLSQL